METRHARSFTLMCNLQLPLEPQLLSARASPEAILTVSCKCLCLTVWPKWCLYKKASWECHHSDHSLTRGSNTSCGDLMTWGLWKRLSKWLRRKEVVFSGFPVRLLLTCQIESLKHINLWQKISQTHRFIGSRSSWREFRRDLDVMLYRYRDGTNYLLLES